ncbi:uncharacterized protein C3orf38 homolog isoform X3 [Cervus elaphus]|uniref:uncharacterized protein C3orf38 homolog isoform X3 n=1 Tax=Cervus elaphus TaxID=9860 RepID=UPI001CC2823D|nr:uncharacterized protein C3orf38 homolog isoform X3 [Cervus elaphus]
MAQTVKTLPAMWETRVQSLDRDVLKKGHGNPLQDSCLQKPVDRGAWQAYSPWGHKERDTTERLPNANISRAHQPPRPQQEGATLLPILRHSAALLTGHTTNPDFRVLPPRADRQASTRAGPSARDLAHAPPSHCSSETGPHPRPPERLGLGCRPGSGARHPGLQRLAERLPAARPTARPLPPESAGAAWLERPERTGRWARGPYSGLVRSPPGVSPASGLSLWRGKESGPSTGASSDPSPRPEPAPRENRPRAGKMAA